MGLNEPRLVLVALVIVTNIITQSIAPTANALQNIDHEKWMMI